MGSDRLRDAYSHVPVGVRDGFKMGELAPAYQTQVAKNYYNDDELPIMKAWAAKAVADGFLAGPFPRDLIETEIGHFHTIPLKLIVTEATESKPRKERVVADASHPREVPG